MSFDDYANHIYQKHRLAVALAIIKSKPANVKTHHYLEDLKSKIDHKMDDDDITICSDDFLIEDDDDDEMNDSVTILKDFYPEFVNNDEKWADDNATSEKPENLSQITYFENSQNYATIDVPPLADGLLSQADRNFNQKFNIELSIPKNVVSKDCNSKTSNIDHNAGATNKSTQKTKERKSETAYLNSKHVAISADEHITVNNYDSQTTVPYTLHGFTQNYTHYSPSQNDIVIPNKYLFGVNNNGNVSKVTNENISEENHNAVVNVNDFENETQFVSTNSLNCKTNKNMINTEEFDYIQTMNMFSQRNNDNFDEIRNINAQSDSNSQKTVADLNVILNKDAESNDIQKSTQYSQNVDTYLNEIQVIEENDTRNSFPSKMNTDETENHPEIVHMDTRDETFRNGQNMYSLSENQDIGNTQTISEIPKVNHHNQLTNTRLNEENNSQNSMKDNQLENDLSGQNRQEEYGIAENEYESQEIISYKVLEEFHKVKSFLNRHKRRMSCDGYSTDSGYRSDSQRSSNRSALQLSGNWLNQSGCCLFNYIMQCPLVAGTRDITNEIAQVLSQLIDKLHDEEKYPSFLEDLLETIDLLLRQVYQGQSSEDNEFLKKDENIQRILLLSKSIHIQKHTIEKMTNILETFHSKVTETDSTYELSNIDEIENITYIFHILEILLKKYLKNRETFSQNSAQNSQEDEKVFKRSSIADIWRKKWNPSQTVFEGSREKKCVLKNCSEILNRIVVDCVSSYSLVAYSALKCFNSMQT